MKSTSQFKTVAIRKTECDWEIIENKIKRSGAKNLAVYIKKEIGKLKVDFENRKIDCGEKIEKRPPLPLETLRIVEELSRKMKTPVSAIITRFIIDPLLSD